MSSSQTPVQQQLSVEQEGRVRDWVSKEVSSGTVVRKELIHWFAEHLIRRDSGNEEATLTPGFVDDFLGRHPDLAQRLGAVLQPDLRKTTKGLNRLQLRMQEDRRRALFGDSPPPPRQPAPYPEGEVISHVNGRYVVRHGNNVTKYTTNRDGMGANDHPNEAMALRFVKEHTTVPVPEIVSSDWDRITMEYIEGQTLQQAWPVLTPEQRSGIMDQLRDYIAQLHAIRGTRLCRLDGQGVIVPSILTRSGGPFENISDFHHWLVRPSKRMEVQSMYWHQITTHLGADHPIVFTHGDIAARNIMVRDGRIVALIDWEFAGWYPDYWEYVFALRGMDNLDWETLGRHLPSLFPKRFDLEYILVKFIVTLS